MADIGEEHLARRIARLLQLRTAGELTSADANELRELQALERSWRDSNFDQTAFDRAPKGHAQDMHPAGRFQRPVAPERGVDTPERRCRLCGAPEREARLLRLDPDTAKTSRQQLVCDSCIRAAEAAHDAGPRFQRPRGEGSAG